MIRMNCALGAFRVGNALNPRLSYFIFYDTCFKAANEPSFGYFCYNN